MHNCIDASPRTTLVNSDVLPCIQLLCKKLKSMEQEDLISKNQALDSDNPKQSYVLTRILLALDNSTLRNQGLLSTLTTEFQLHKILIMIA